jgi:hypothetical protein
MLPKLAHPVPGPEQRSTVAVVTAGAETIDAIIDTEITAAANFIILQLTSRHHQAYEELREAIGPYKYMTVSAPQCQINDAYGRQQSCNLPFFRALRCNSLTAEEWRMSKITLPGTGPDTGTDTGTPDSVAANTGTENLLPTSADAKVFPGDGWDTATNRKPQGLNTQTEIQVHIAELEEEVRAEEVFPPVDYVLTERRTFQEVSEDVERLRNEINNLRARLAIIQQQAATVVRSNVEWADASAHAQLGPYPWAKLACAMAATFIGARVLGRAAEFAAIALPLIARPPRGR